MVLDPISWVMVGVCIAVGSAATAWDARRRRKRRAAALDGAKPAFEDTLSIGKLRRDPDKWKQRLHGKIARVHTTSLIERSRNNERTMFNSFVLDSHGEAHDLELSSDQAQVEHNAQWVADIFGVEYEPL